MAPVRVRFAPSPTGPLHIGGLRTALYNYLFARANNGKLVLRLEDTDQKRYQEGAETHIRESLAWCGIEVDEGPEAGGAYGPYRQTERRATYQEYVQQLLDAGKAYYAFDTEDELEQRRAEEKEAGNHNFRYDASTRGSMRNSITLTQEETRAMLHNSSPYVVRFRIDPGETVTFTDVVRGEVSFATDELGDQVLLKTDGLPTYHMAVVTDDHLMEISHIIRGEEWISSTALHVLLYRAFGWAPPVFVHLPLLLNPNGKGKLSKRKAVDLGFPIFALAYDYPDRPESISGFRDEGYLPEALVNFLAFLGWNPGTDQELFTLDELVGAFRLDRINNSGARFDIDKAKWFNQQYLIATQDAELAPLVQAEYAKAGHELSTERATRIAGLLKERVHLLPEFFTQGRYFVEPVQEYEEKTVRKKWKPALKPKFAALADRLEGVATWEAPTIKEEVVAFMKANDLGFGAVLPILRVAVSGTVQGPDAFGILEVVGREESVRRLRKAYADFPDS